VREREREKPRKELDEEALLLARDRERVGYQSESFLDLFMSLCPIGDVPE